jgi:hypothetical protein
MLKRDSLTRSVVGLRIFTFGAISVLPFAFPAIIRMIKPRFGLKVTGRNFPIP